jgi:putative OmpL-like beta-barrel porin-2
MHVLLRVARCGFALALASSVSLSVAAQSAVSAARPQAPADDDVKQLRQTVTELAEQVKQLRQELAAVKASAPTANPARTSSSGVADANAPQSAAPLSLSPEDRIALDFMRDTTVNFAFDGYYGYNFNQPVGRVNLLRAYDVSSNSFSINQATMILEQAPDPARGRRFGARVDLQYGQATETLQGNAANELRPQAYRPVFQVYGTYVAPVMKGLTIDFGKFASAIGYEGNYNKDQFNYSRSYFFNFLPFYHMGFRNTLAVNDKLSLGYWLVNGSQQTEDFNGFKSQAFQLVVKPTKTVQANLIYYVGREQRDLVSNLNPGLPTLPTQPGLSTTTISPAPNGRFHIVDAYVSWNVKPKLTFVGEADYVINRQFDHSAPAHVTGGAAYVHYQLTPKVALTGRGEYLSDRGGLFSGTTQALKETTLTYEYKLGEGLVARTEWRRDFSNRPFFLTDTPDVLKSEQNTATLGLIWWWGRKQGSW